MAFLVFGLMGICGLVALAGLLMLLAAAFSESVLWGIACLVLPGALVVFIVTHWEEAKKGAICWFGGVGALFAIAVVGMPSVREELDADRAEKAAASSATAPKVTSCPAVLPPIEGFATYCCTPSGWSLVAQTGCASTFAPTLVCGPSAYGTTQLEGCSTLGAKKKKDPF